MEVLAQVQYYPVRQDELSPAIDAFWQALDGHAVEVERSELQTVVTGEMSDVLDALEDAWDAAHELGPGAMEVTIKDARERDVPGWDLG